MICSAFFSVVRNRKDQLSCIDEEEI